jgi:uncharacterized protein YfaS (alpha-2-macroglobulin family)
MDRQARVGRSQRFIVREFAKDKYYSFGKQGTKDFKSDLDFEETVLWRPLVVTDEQGRATFEFQLPDTATQFRIIADAHTTEGRLGTAEQAIVAEPASAR